MRNPKRCAKCADERCDTTLDRRSGDASDEGLGLQLAMEGFDAFDGAHSLWNGGSSLDEGLVVPVDREQVGIHHT